VLAWRETRVPFIKDFAFFPSSPGPSPLFFRFCQTVWFIHAGLLT
jgi:hypothetical protein